MRSIYDWAAALMASFGARSEFACGDCEKWEQCGQPPSETCVVRAAQLAREDWTSRRRARALLRGSWTA